MVAEILRLLPHFTEALIRMLLFFVLLKTKEKKYLMKIILFIFLVCVDTVFTEIITTIKTLDNYSVFILLTGRFFLADYFFAGTHFERLTKVILIYGKISMLCLYADIIIGKNCFSTYWIDCMSSFQENREVLQQRRLVLGCNAFFRKFYMHQHHFKIPAFTFHADI